ncbi:MAG: glycosyltransferase family protein [Deltaproteobacteria bacterium]|nr:glycosyltransferase family protein [Deltaproteobacteria bacterium]
MPLGKDMAPVVAIIQARMSSTRLPSKVMKTVCGNPILWHVVNRLKASRLIEDIMVATTTDPSDDVIEEWCALTGTASYRGSLEDVLDRYYNAARKIGAKTIVRITADCPLIDPELVDKVIGKFSEGGYDHTGIDSSYPDGLDAEVFSFAALEKAHKEARLASEREHVTPYIWKNPGFFRLSSIKNDKDLSHLRWTVDDAKDFLLVTRIFEGMSSFDGVFHMNDILEFLDKNPGLLEINSKTMRNEGYAKSLKEDKVIDKAV